MKHKKIYMSSSLQKIGWTLGLLLPLQAGAYFTPQEVLMSQDFFLPPTAREAQGRAENQTVTATQRREYEQSQLEYRQEVVPDNSLDSELHGAAELNTTGTATVQLEDILSEKDLELLRAVRLLDSREERLLNRVQDNQYAMEYYGNRLHGGAPPLPPTGAGGIIAALTMLGAIVWTIRSVKNAEKRTKVIRQ